ncbi:hypothetical protein [Rhizosaccharibacter radicis]|uniref:Oxidase n=1 Tax=Rhizosaccharibacter radicis TaxID=2782605 RepID=A0ABT1VT15_9PROT|nr:hypothetical protein [Acetobacteraceae bacterium KSS12]
MTADEKHELRRRMRPPAFATLALMLLLAVNVTLGILVPFRHVWIVETLVVIAMILTVLLVSMELPREPPVIRFFAGIGFCWVGFLVAMTLVDYLTR